MIEGKESEGNNEPKHFGDKRFDERRSGSQAFHNKNVEAVFRKKEHQRSCERNRAHAAHTEKACTRDKTDERGVKDGERKGRAERGRQGSTPNVHQRTLHSDKGCTIARAEPTTPKTTIENT